MSRYDILTRGLAAIVTTVMTLSAAASQQTGLTVALPESDVEFSKTQNVMTLTDTAGEPGRLYVANQFAANGSGTIVDYESGAANGSVTAVRLAATPRRTVVTHDRVASRQYPLPWNVTVIYGLNGPQTAADDIAGASGLVDIRIIVEPNPDVAGDYANRSIPVIAFTVPDSVTDDITIGDGMTLTSKGSDFLVSGVGKPGGRTVFDCYMNAKRFSMSQLAFASVQADDTTSFTAALTAIAQQADGLVDTLVTTGSTADQQLIDKLTAMRNSEEKLGKQAVAEKSAAHKAAFDAYMAQYVSSYTTHLSGSIGSSTQMQALIGTAGELSGDTPMAHAVTDLANAVNAVSAAHQHEGAVRAIDDVIRKIRQRGTSGLVDEISEQMGQEATKGTTGYKAGQSQLSTAMIPYSMAYTVAYTKHLSELTGGSSANAAQYEQQANAATSEEFATGSDHAGDRQKVQSAMDSLAAASEHTGAANALQQISVQFAKELSVGDDTADGGDSADGDSADGDVAEDDVATIRYGWAGPDADAGTMAVRAERKRVAAVTKANQEAAERKAKELASGKSDDDAQSSMNINDVMGSASGLGMLGGAVKGGDGSGKSAGSGSSGDGKAGSGTSGSSSAGSAGSGDAAVSTVAQVSPVYGMAGRHPRALLHADLSGLIDETVEIGSAADLLTAAAAALAGGSADASGSAGATGDGGDVRADSGDASVGTDSRGSADAAADDDSPAARLAAAFAAAGDSATYDVISTLNRHTDTVRLLIIRPAVG
ncbi:hypothetical protein [Bifidobacterium leontopitheci]|uniref:Tubuliform spidroin n=1 Tax=Bifidobacterium leontopitheci TaxID=2650774 RepID=A0A6I1GHA4_9BIFI|nr:hypothetical protein [Bifidobacterium leontopitheci]KAB7791034.1 hypothetical protein F7D09_0390 [Bifidobacterium leontopitheci]